MPWGKRIALIFALSLVSCGKPTLDTGQFQSYVDKFQTEAARFGHPITVNDLVILFDHLTGEEFGLCETGAGMTPTIHLDEPGWNQADDATRESLLFHELGHCVLGQSHRNDTAAVDGSSGAIPTSIMNATIVDGDTYEAHRDYYLREYFGASASFSSGFTFRKEY